jgi:hypothetical protein
MALGFNNIPLNFAPIEMPNNPYVGLSPASGSAQVQLNPLKVYCAGPSFRNGGPLKDAHPRVTGIDFDIIEEAETNFGGFRPYNLPERARPFGMPKQHSFTVPITFEVLYPDGLSAVELDPTRASLYFVLGMDNCLSHVEATISINPLQNSYEEVMHQIIALATNRLNLRSLVSDRQDWMWVMIAQCPLFQEKVTEDAWEEVWPLLNHDTVKLNVYFIEVCPNGKDVWETWKRDA